MEKVRLEPLDHHGKSCIAIVGSMAFATYQAVRAFPGRLYSKTHGCWYLEYDTSTLARLIAELERHQVLEISDKFNVERPPASLLQLPEGYHEHLVRVRYSEATIKTYESQLRQFLLWLRPGTLENLNDEVIQRYLFHLANDRKVSISTQNTAINAIKFYLEKVQRGERTVYYVDRPMRESKLPVILNQEEVKALIRVTKNVKHRCIVMVLYASGLRMSELLNLRWEDFDEPKLQLVVRGGKGRKDRVTIISRSAIDYVKYYMKQYQPKEYLFESLDGGKYSSRSVNLVIHRSGERAGIRKRISAHTLRHTFATHLLENKTDIRYIQVVMGHESSKTTERYTQMTTKGFSGMRSPLDSLDMDFGISTDSSE